MRPGDILSDKPVVLEKASSGSPHKGPLTRGKRINKIIAKGIACASILKASLKCCFSLERISLSGKGFTLLSSL